MCLIAFAIGADPACPLLIAANRDEFFDRPTEPLHRWTLPDGSAVLGGRDAREGGTWLGVGESGRVAMLTNVRSAQPGPGRRSRGELPTRWLQGHTDWSGLLAGIAPEDYGGFNLVVGDLRQGFWAWITNRDPARTHDEHAVVLHSQPLAPGVYGLSNAALNTPWPKTVSLTSAVGRAVQLPERDEQLRLLVAALADADIRSDDTLPQTGMPVEIERALSSPFVDMAERGYGTRSSLIVSAGAPTGRDSWGAIRLDEWTHRPSGQPRHRWADGERRSLSLNG